MFKAVTQISFEGLNVNRTINKLSQKYALYNVIRKGKNCKFTVKTRVAKQIVAYLEEKCYNVTEVRKIGSSGVIEYLRLHFLLPLFLIFSVVLLFASSNFCWTIEVVGDFSEEQVLHALEQCDVRVGASLYRLDTDGLENRLSTQLDAMYAVVNRKGSALFVNVVKKKQADSPVDMHARRDIFATCDGKVTYLLCEQGTAAVKVGDEVKNGDVLIFGFRTYNDGTTADVYALGRVVIQQSCSAFVAFDGVATETVETGNVFAANYVVLFGKSYGKVPPFESFRTERKQVRLFPLNLTVERVIFYETKLQTKTVTLEECAEQLKAQALFEATSKAQFTVKYVSYQVNGGVLATVFGETEIN